MIDSDEESIQFNAEPTPRHTSSAGVSRLVTPKNTHSIRGGKPIHSPRPLDSPTVKLATESNRWLGSRPTPPSARPPHSAAHPSSSQTSIVHDSESHEFKGFHGRNDEVATRASRRGLGAIPPKPFEAPDVKTPRTFVPKQSFMANPNLAYHEPEIKSISSIVKKEPTAGDTTCSESKVYMNIYSNVFEEVQFRKMASDTKFSRLLKGLLIAARDHLSSPSTDGSSVTPPPPASSGDLYFLKSGTVVELTATPRQYGLDKLHASENNGLDLVFHYHPLGKFDFGLYCEKSFEPSQERKKTGIDGVLRPTSSNELANSIPPPPSSLPSRRSITSPNKNFTRFQSAPTPTNVLQSAPEVPQHRSPRRKNPDTEHSTGPCSIKVCPTHAHNSSLIRKDTPNRRNVVYEPKSALQSIKSPCLKVWPSEVPFSAVLAAAPPHLTNRSLLSQRTKRNDTNADDAKNAVAQGPNETSLSTNPALVGRPEAPMSLQRELEAELEKAMSLLSSGKGARLALLTTKPLEEFVSDDDEAASSKSTLFFDGFKTSTPVFMREVDQTDISNYHAHLMQQLKVDRLRHAHVPQKLNNSDVNHADPIRIM